MQNVQTTDTKTCKGEKNAFNLKNNVRDFCVTAERENIADENPPLR